MCQISAVSGISVPPENSYLHHIASQITKSLGLILVRHPSDTGVLDQYLIYVILWVFAIWYKMSTMIAVLCLSWLHTFVNSIYPYLWGCFTSTGAIMCSEVTLINIGKIYRYQTTTQRQQRVNPVYIFGDVLCGLVYYYNKIFFPMYPSLHFI